MSLDVHHAMLIGVIYPARRHAVDDGATFRAPSARQFHKVGRGSDTLRSVAAASCLLA